MNHIQTNRLYMRDFLITDFAAVHEYGRIPDFSQYELWGPNIEPHSKEFIEQAIKKSKNVPRFDFEMAVILQASDQLIGSARIARETEKSHVGSIGYAINPKFQRYGYATEIAKSLIIYGFENLNLSVIYATCDTRNTASIRVLEKSGMFRVGHMIGDRKIRGHIYDSYRYEITLKN